MVYRTRKQVRLPLTWAMLSQGRRVVASMVDGEDVMWLGLAMSYFLLCRASELWAYANGQVHLEFCLTRNCFVFGHGGIQVAFENRSAASNNAGKLFSVDKRSEESRVHHHANAAENRVGDGARADRSFRSLVGTAQCAPSATRGGAIEDEEHVGRMESVY